MLKRKEVIVYVLNKKGKPLMPTRNCGKVAYLLKHKKAVVVSKFPFTIRLKYETTNYVQPLTFGMDTGRENIGVAVSDSKGNCFYVSDVKTYNKSVTKNMKDRKIHRQERRRYRRNKKQRRAFKSNTQFKNGDKNIYHSKKECLSRSISYPGMDEYNTCKVIKGKEAKFNNRRRPEGWLTPSARQLLQVHLKVLEKVRKFLPISDVIIENTCFDFQKLDNADISKWDYQKGLLYGYKDYKDYIFTQQKGTCLLCKQNRIEHYHHIVSQSKQGSNTVRNIVGLCKDCHDKVHKDNNISKELSELKDGICKQYEISLLNVIMPYLIDLFNDYCSKNILSFKTIKGFETKRLRNDLYLDKDHYIDAYVISVSDLNLDYNSRIFYPNILYHQRRYKKKSNGNINKVGSRKYYYNGKLVAVNRHKAMEQKEDSLEDHLREYSESHSKKEVERYFHSLIVEPAQRIYTYRKKRETRLIKPGDVVLYYKKLKIGKEKRKVIVVNSIKVDKIIYLVDGKEKSFKLEFAKLLESSLLGLENFEYL